jgi:hypothetical protein
LSFRHCGNPGTGAALAAACISSVHTTAIPADDMVEGALGTFDELPASTNMDSPAT